MIDLYAELRRIVGALDGDDIDYALCGGVALAIHGIPRATLDVDLLVRAADVDRVRRTLGPVGYRLTGADMEFADGAVVISRLVKPDPDSEDVLIVDLLHATAPLEPDMEWQAASRLGARQHLHGLEGGAHRVETAARAAARIGTTSTN